MLRSAVSLGSLMGAACVALLAAATFCSPLRANEADDRYAVAAGHYAQRRWKLAAEEFQAFVEKHPHHPRLSQGIFFLGEALVQLGRLEEAAVHFRSYLVREPQGPYARAALFRAGEAAYLAGKPDLGKVELERFLATYADDKLNAYVLPYLGGIALGQSDPASAEKHYRRGLTQFPQGQMQDECRFGLARALEKSGKTEEAEQLYRTVAAKSGGPLADDARFHLGALQYASGRFEEALQTFEPFESTLAESPWQPTARLGRGWALLKLGRLAEAASTFQSIASDADVGVEARYWLGLAQKAREDWPAAAETLLAAAADHPRHKLTAALLFHAGDSLLCAGQTAEAAKQFDRVLDLDVPDNEWIDDAWRGKVQAALVAKDHAALDRHAAEFGRRFPKSPLKADVQRLLGQSLIERKQYHRAAEVLGPLVAHDGKGPQGLEDRYLLSLAQAGLQQHQEALDLLAPVAASATGVLKADAELSAASLLMKLKRYEEAIAPLESLLASNPAVDDAVKGLGNLAICYAETDRLDKARKLYVELLAKHPNHELIAPTTEQLAEAALAAGDTAWSGHLFARLAKENRSPEDDLKGLSGLGWSRYKAGQLEPAAATFEELLKRDPEPALAAEAALARGQILQKLGRPDAALAMYDRVVEQYPNSEQFARALWASALLRDDLQQDREAAERYQRLAATYPQFSRIDAVLYHWAWALDDLGRSDEAAALFERLRREHPKSSFWADATFRLAQRAFEAKDYRQADKLAAEVRAGQPGARIRQSALYLQGQVAAVEENWDAARRSFESLLAEDPESSLRLMAEYGIAEAIFRQSDYEAAGEHFDRLLLETRGRDEPWLAVIPLRLAQSLCHRKKWDEAYEIASKIEAEHPHFEEQYEADYVIGRCLSARADFERAREAYRKVIRSPGGAKTETAAKAQLMIAESYYHQKNYETALREYLALEILYDYPTWQAAAVFQGAKCHELLGEWTQAQQLYTKLLRTYPNTGFREEAESRLRAAEGRLASPPAT